MANRAKRRENLGWILEIGGPCPPQGATQLNAERQQLTVCDQQALFNALQGLQGGQYPQKIRETLHIALPRFAQGTLGVLILTL